MNKQIVQVTYPIKNDEDRLVLRTSLDDWQADVLPKREAEDTYVFELLTGRSYFHFKPCLRTPSGVKWAVGGNVITPYPQDRVLFPVFRSEPNGTITELQSLVADHGSRYRYRIYLPPGYRENTRRHYPVCYMNDGHNLFFPSEAFAGQTWRVQDTVDLLDGMNSIEPCIVVAIYPNERFHDYTEPGCDDYAQFLRTKLVPHVERFYRTLDGPDKRVVMGSSLGGVISFYLAWHHDDVFGRAACLSSTFGYDNRLFRAVEDAKRKRNIKLYLDSGWPGDNFEVTKAMANLLISRGYGLRDHLHYVAVPQATHDEHAWSERLHLPFQYLLGFNYGVEGITAA